MNRSAVAAAAAGDLVTGVSHTPPVLTRDAESCLRLDHWPNSFQSAAPAATATATAKKGGKAGRAV
jgi:hypothetical protein